MKFLPATAKLDTADYTRQYRHLTVGPDVTLEDLLRPGFWVHHEGKILNADIIDVVSTDFALDVQLRVIGREKGLLYVRPLRVYAPERSGAEPVEEVDPGEVPDGYVVDHTDKTSWRARTRNPMVMVTTGAMSKAEAIAAAKEHARKANGGTAPVARGDVEIPEGWKDLKWQDKRSLASKLTDDAVHNGADADAAIEVELERRKP